MQVLILEEDASLRTAVAAALTAEGFEVFAFGRLDPAKEAARRIPVDVLVLGETAEGRVAGDLALLAEWRNPGLGAILLTDRRGDAAEELFENIPCLQALVGRRAAPGLFVQFVVSAAASAKARAAMRPPSTLSEAM